MHALGAQFGCFGFWLVFAAKLGSFRAEIDENPPTGCIGARG